MEIYGSRRAEQTPLSPTRVREPPTNGPRHPLEGLSYILLHRSPIGRLRLLDFAVQAGSSRFGSSSCLPGPVLI